VATLTSFDKLKMNRDLKHIAAEGSYQRSPSIVTQEDTPPAEELFADPFTSSQRKGITGDGNHSGFTDRTVVDSYSENAICSSCRIANVSCDGKRSSCYRSITDSNQSAGGATTSEAEAGPSDFAKATSFQTLPREADPVPLTEANPQPRSRSNSPLS
jgi:hypothetical protein